MGDPSGGFFAFRDPIWFLALLALPLVMWLRGRRAAQVLIVPFASKWSGRRAVTRSQLPLLLAGAGLVLLVTALARPQQLEERRFVHREGYDLALAIDVSGSMRIEDQALDGEQVDRLRALKPILEAFTARRTGDRIGVVAFGGRAYTLAPLSFDHAWLRRQIARLKIGLVEDGTAIGDALALALSRLEVRRGRDADETAGADDGSRDDRAGLGSFVILLTDGANNAGAIPPLEAARLAAAKGIPVYTIGTGRAGLVPLPIYDESGRKVGYRRVRSELDEKTLRRIAELTGGRYFRAMDADTVDAAFAAIDAERKIEFDAKANLRAREYYQLAAWPGLCCALLGFWLGRPATRWGA